MGWGGRIAQCFPDTCKACESFPSMTDRGENKRLSQPAIKQGFLDRRPAATQASATPRTTLPCGVSLAQKASPCPLSFLHKRTTYMVVQNAKAHF